MSKDLQKYAHIPLKQTNNRVWIDKVRVYEHENNWAEYVGL